jgi:hypothetical protein
VGDRQDDDVLLVLFERSHVGDAELKCRHHVEACQPVPLRAQEELPAVGSRHSSALEMTLREGPARARFQVALKSNGRVFVGEFNNYVPTSRSTRRGVRAAAHVVVRYPSVNFSCHANVELGGWIGVLTT